MKAGAYAGDVLSGKTFWGLTSGGWGPRVGTLATKTLSASNDKVAAGYYSATTLRDVDPDLADGNIKSGSSIFGVSGSVLQAMGTAEAGDVLTGKTFSNTSSTGVSGAMPNNSAVNTTPGTAEQTIAAGYHNGSKYGGRRCRPCNGQYQVGRDNLCCVRQILRSGYGKRNRGSK